jgi:hypothetical protein
VGHDLGGGVRGEVRIPDDAVLEVDDDEGGTGIERAESHGQAFPGVRDSRTARVRDGRVARVSFGFGITAG